MIAELGFGPGVCGSIPRLSETLSYTTLVLVLNPDVNKRRFTPKVTFSMVHVSASKQSPNVPPRESL